MNADDTNGERFHVGMTIAGRYRVERPIGEGAMGAVALARHVSLDETVAIKFLRPELRRDPAANARLSREAKALARIKSDHVARVLDVGVTLSVGPYMVMEYLEGTDLGEVLDTEGPLPVARAVECVLQVCEALTVAHTAGITHRDIKPQNLFLARHGRFETLKILDFGIAEDTAPASSSALAGGAEPGGEEAGAGTASGQNPVGAALPVYGTPSYMAPERVRNDPGADHRSDIWSVGVVLHELVTGRAVFDAPTITETCARIVSNEPIEIERNDARLPPNLRGIIARCLERDPDRRYQNVEELAAALAPLATMNERFRGRSTGAFSKRLLEEEIAQQAEAPVRRLPAVLAARDAAAIWREHITSSSLVRWLRERPISTSAAMVLASVAVVWLAASGADDVRWMDAPPVPLRAEPSQHRPVEAAPALEESVLPLSPAIGASAPTSEAALSSSAEPVEASSTPAGVGADAHTLAAPVDMAAPPRSGPNGPVPERGPNASRARSPAAPATARLPQGSDPKGGRSRVRLVQNSGLTEARPENQAAVVSGGGGARASNKGAEQKGSSAQVVAPKRAPTKERGTTRAAATNETPAKRSPAKDTQKKSKKLPAWLGPYQSKSP